jgi:hypothetical protein
VRAAHEPLLANALLRLLLDRVAPRDRPGAEEWATCARLAGRNGVIVRWTECLVASGIELPALVARLASRERQRARAMLKTMQLVAALCRARDVAFLFPKALQHLPDMGRDLDLLVLSRTHEVDKHLRRELQAEPLPVGLRGRLAASTSYRLARCPAVLDVLHGRVGVVGEHTEFPETLLRRARPEVVEGVTFDLPSAEDQLLLQAMQKVYGRTHMRISDIVSTTRLLRDPSLDWDYLIQAARHLGILSNLSCYLSFVGQIHVNALGESLPCPIAAGMLLTERWGRVRFSGEYRFPLGRVHLRIYVKRLAAEVAARRWASAGRHGLMPILAADAVWSRLFRRARQRRTDATPIHATEALEV